MTIVFVSYQPGAKGKFVSEVCDISRLGIDPAKNQLVTQAGGAPGWVTKIKQSLDLKHPDFVTKNDYTGIFPEKENYVFYIDTVIEELKKNHAENYAVDTHYVGESSLRYMLDSGVQVIRIVVDTYKELEKIRTNFFYKNFIANFENNKDYSLQLANKLFSEGNVKFLSSSELDSLKSVSTQYLNEWTKTQLKLLNKLCPFMILPEKKQVVQHENLLEVNLSDLYNFQTFETIIKFVSGELNDIAVKRINSYLVEQEKILSFDEYIDQFLENKNV